MAHTDFQSVNEYIATRPKAVRSALRLVRRAIRNAVPDAEEVISYQMPAYRLHGRILLYFAGWTEHYALYASSAGLVKTFKDELAPYEMSKGTIRFPLSEPVPSQLIAAMATFRADEVGARKKARKRKTTRR